MFEKIYLNWCAITYLFQQKIDGGESGVNIHNCFNTMASQPEGAIRKAIEELAEEGFIYSTVDEDHYKHAS